MRRSPHARPGGVSSRALATRPPPAKLPFGDTLLRERRMSATRPAVTRFAPSPTGRLHVGNIRTALVCWLAARAAGGTFLLRLDDTDRARSTEEFVEAIRADLGWLGPRARRRGAPVGSLRALRGGVRGAARRRPRLSLLRERGGAGRQAPHRARARAAADLRSRRAEADRGATGEAGGERRRAALALQARWPRRSPGTIWSAARSISTAATLSDPVIRRADGSWLYLLPSVIDDIDMKVSHVVRGEDHVTNTALQLQMFEALGAHRPALRAHGAAGRERRQALQARGFGRRSSGSATRGSSRRRCSRCWRGSARASR